MNVRETRNHKKQMNFQFLSPRLIMIIEEEKISLSILSDDIHE